MSRGTTEKNFSHIRPANGHGQSRLQITCAMCGEKQSVGGHKIDQNVAEKNFANRGWILGADRTRDKCPDCNRKKKRDGANPWDNIMVEIPPIKKDAIAVSIADPPREMSRDDRRIIFAKLQDTYVDENVGYDNGWSDKRISDDLGVPRAWVEKIREENFGADKSTTESKETIEAARKLLAEAIVIAENLETRKREAAIAVSNLEARKRETDLAVSKFASEWADLKAGLLRIEKLMK